MQRKRERERRSSKKRKREKWKERRKWRTAARERIKERDDGEGWQILGRRVAMISYTPHIIIITQYGSTVYIGIAMVYYH